jgi:hypothetical protein
MESESACIIIKGMVEYTDDDSLESSQSYENRIIETGLINIILANMAAHPQYSGNKLHSLQNNPFENIAQFKNLSQEIKQMKSFSKIHGCCETNKSLFFIKHIFCGYPADQLLEFYPQREDCNKKQLRKYLETALNME